ncbi:FAD-binding oxidoreductase [Halobacteriales archaeon QS_1_68_17]|nr:MAG: FAD-binding oxidoreductase [Halobacteriales archaeon QS_1_68_17]
MGSLVDLPGRADVVVVGGGIMGTSAAYFLAAETDRDVVLVEKDRIAGGSTGDSSAILRHHYGEKAVYAKTAWWSHQFYRAFAEEVGEELAHGESPLVRFADEDRSDYARAGYEVLRDLDIPVTRYEADELADRYPALETDPFSFAVSDDAAGYSDGTDAAGGFARAAQELGATVVTGVAVTDVATEDGAVAGVETDEGPVEADRVVLAAGPWTTRLTERLGVEIPIETTREQVLVLDPPAEFAAEHPDLVPTSGPPGGGWYMRPDFGGGVIVATHHTGSEVDPDAYSDTPDQETIVELLDGLESFAPGLADADIKGQYCGVYSTTPDHDFVIDQVGPEGCYVACGFSGHGFKHGPAVGKMLCDLVTAGETDLVDDVDYFSLDRFADDPAGHLNDIDS